MYDSEVSSEYNLQSCEACLSSNRQLTVVGDLVDIFCKICDNSPKLTTQTNICWECVALLKKVLAFKKKVENAQKILDFCIDKNAPHTSLSDLTSTFTETTTFVPILVEDDDEEYEENDKLGDIKMGLMNADEYLDQWKEKGMEEPSLFKIENVWGQCDIFDTKPFLSSGSSEFPLRHAPTQEEAAQTQRCWQRAAMLVYRRLCAHKYGRYFLRPVNDDLAPNYSKIVKRPMDLSTIRKNIKDGVISTTAELRRDLLLMFSNALLYNGSHLAIHHMARELRQEALLELKLLVSAQTHSAALPTRRRLR